MNGFFRFEGGRSLPLSLRFVLPLALVLAVLAYAVVPLVDRLTLKWFARDLDIRSNLVASTISEPLAEFANAGDKSRINALFLRAIQDERLFAIGYRNPEGRLVYRTQTFPDSLSSFRIGGEKRAKPLIRLPEGTLHVSVVPVALGDGRTGELVLVHDMSFVERRSAETRKYVFGLFAVLAVIISMITVLVAHLSWRGWMEGVRAMLRGEGIFHPFSKSTNPELQPLVGDLKALLRNIDAERRLADDATVSWTPESLRKLLHNQMAGDQVLVVSNREPYVHTRSEDGIVVMRPASGLVTAVEPVLRACSGTWIAHGSGNADREVVDRNDRVLVPPATKEYTLRRVWLTPEEEQGYYYGFANEGMWPLCHIAHVRPIFRSEDWARYKAVNRRFAEAVVLEARRDDPVVLVQDYHFALLPTLIREALPKATVITFWHIPWPNPESFGICPWREEVLRGMLGSTILGFHTPFHRKNFIETVDRYLETRIEHESSTISHGGQLTLVESYPISIQWPPSGQEVHLPTEECRAKVRAEIDAGPDTRIALGVDRLDYTKGIIERFRAMERMLDLHPEMVGRATFIQIAAPSRSSLDDYRALEVRVRALADEINRKFMTDDDWRPIDLRIRHYDQEELPLFYRGADVCMVTSLHDGMNLVAKEFVAARDDERGVLVLSQFAGAANELHEALIVNPYHIEQTADALHRAMTMTEGEQRERMASMRSLIRDFNVYRWAGRMLLDAARLRHRERLVSRIGSS